VAALLADKHTCHDLSADRLEREVEVVVVVALVVPVEPVLPALPVEPALPAPSVEPYLQRFRSIR